MKKDLILITSFTPDQRRQQILRDLVYGIDNELFDIMVSSHSVVPLDISEKVDYLVYEKNNDIDFDFKNKFLFAFENEDFYIFSTEPKRYNHFVPVIRHIISGLSYAKNLGYSKVHYFEYDSLIRNSDELLENSLLLEDYSAIYYKVPHLSYPNSPISFNLNKISPKWFSLNPENFEGFLRKEGSTKIVEEYEWDLLWEFPPNLVKNIETLEERGITVALNSDLEKNKWIVPIYLPENNQMFIFSRVESEEEVNLKVMILINDQSVIKLDRSLLYVWNLIHLGNYKEIDNLKIIIDGLATREYDFTSIDREEFIKYNNLVKK